MVRGREKAPSPGPRSCEARIRTQCGWTGELEAWWPRGRAHSQPVWGHTGTWDHWELGERGWWPGAWSHTGSGSENAHRVGGLALSLPQGDGHSRGRWGEGGSKVVFTGHLLCTIHFPMPHLLREMGENSLDGGNMICWASHIVSLGLSFLISRTLD